jgi:hypothetical protein
MAVSSAAAWTTAWGLSWCSRPLRLLKASGPAPATVTAVATTREEISYTGGGARTSASDLEAVAALVVDVTHATDYPGLGQAEARGVQARRRADHRAWRIPHSHGFRPAHRGAERRRSPTRSRRLTRYPHRCEAIFNSHRGSPRARVGTAAVHAQPERDGPARGRGEHGEVAGGLLPARQEGAWTSCRDRSAEKPRGKREREAGTLRSFHSCHASWAASRTPCSSSPSRPCSAVRGRRASPRPADPRSRRAGSTGAAG